MQVIITAMPFFWSIVVAILHFLGIYEASMTILTIAAVSIILLVAIVITIIVFQVKKFLKKIHALKDEKENFGEDEFSKIIHEQTMTIDEVFNAERKKNDEEDLR